MSEGTIMPRRLLGLWLLLLLAVPLRVGATTYYATPSGGGTNCQAATSRDTPIATLNAGVRCLASGDTLILLDGTYPECVENAIPSGTAQQHTIVQAAHRGHAIVTGPGNACAGGVFHIGGAQSTAGTARSYITLESLTLTIDPHSVTTGVLTTGGADYTDGPHHLHFLNLDISGCMDTGSVSSFCVGLG